MKEIQQKQIGDLRAGINYSLLQINPHEAQPKPRFFGLNISIAEQIPLLSSHVPELTGCRVAEVRFDRPWSLRRWLASESNLRVILFFQEPVGRLDMILEPESSRIEFVQNGGKPRKEKGGDPEGELARLHIIQQVLDVVDPNKKPTR